MLSLLTWLIPNSSGGHTMERLETKKTTPPELLKEPTGLKLLNTSDTTADYAIIFIDFEKIR